MRWTNAMGVRVEYCEYRVWMGAKSDRGTVSLSCVVVSADCECDSPDVQVQLQCKFEPQMHCSCFVSLANF